MSEADSSRCTIRLWAVIGPHDSGKSSVIGALAGFEKRGGGGRRDVMLRGGGYLQIHAFRQSVQEAGRTPEQSVDGVTKTVSRKISFGAIRYYNILLALRSDSHKGLPTGDNYIEHYVRAGWDVASLALLDMDDLYEPYARFGAPTCEVPNTVENAARPRSRIWVFGAVRNHFGWA